jgi:hypothetical protein
MFLKFGDKTKTKDLINKKSEDISESIDNDQIEHDFEVYDPNNKDDRRSMVLNKYHKNDENKN